MGGKKRTIASVAFIWLLLVVFVLVILNRQSIVDWLVLRSYVPSPQISAIAEKTAMSEEGKKLFYVNDPQLLDSTNFHTHCDQGEKTIVLGCYNGVGIYLFDVTDDRLVGVEEVTSAHEMLHAAYDRLSSSEKSKIDALLVSVSKSITNQRLLSLFESYRQKDLSEFNNELHSIIGTEVAELPEELEAYYSRYFINRQRVVELAVAYEKVFSDLKDQVEKLDADLVLRKSEIDSREAQLISEAAQLEQDRAELNAHQSNNQINQYNAKVPVYNAAVNRYNTHLAEVKQLIAEYNNLVVERNKIVVTQNDLVNSLNSKAPEIE